MLKRLLATFAFLALIGAPAFAGELDSTFGNTVRVTLESGAVVQYHFNADNTYTMIAPDGLQVSGAWVIRNGELCSTPAGGAENCVAVQAGRNVGDTWTQTDTDGSTVTIAIVGGRS